MLMLAPATLAVNKIDFAEGAASAERKDEAAQPNLGAAPRDPISKAIDLVPRTLLPAQP